MTESYFGYFYFLLCQTATTFMQKQVFLLHFYAYFDRIMGQILCLFVAAKKSSFTALMCLFWLHNGSHYKNRQLNALRLPILLLVQQFTSDDDFWRFSSQCAVSFVLPRLLCLEDANEQLTEAFCCWWCPFSNYWSVAAERFWLFSFQP